ncbi:uncharacterized protein LOC124450550 [Xenia sp. Carnegie-2017]|uniref:uncharacterized protein LOC124450550 n=1 Tax=Xenia sp. Carnegie-2017 TaxID=2897299 RepID=UPI001F04FED5|nr:uncharacterized protein LOC124450550 [Xenia sp. Carnegie-2017]
MHVIHSGQKVMELFLKDYQMTLIDSLNFLSMPLSDLPETFGLDLSMYSKGDFPFKFNTRENQKYVGPILALEYYSPDAKSKCKRDELIAWHQNLIDEGYVLDFQKEMYKYCSQDVTILRLCCMEFRKLFLAETRVDPFCYCTIASSVMAVFHSNYLKEKTIGIVPRNMYRDSNKPYSNSAIEWLEFVSFQTKSNIKHALHNGGEKVIHDSLLNKHYYVDGFCEDTNTVYEFYGKVYHGCPLCLDLKSENPYRTGTTPREAYNRTIDREKRLTELGYKVKTIWEHDFKQLRQTPQMQHFLNTHEFITDLYPADSFFGGRVEGFKLFRKAEENEKIFYNDFTSLYPFVMKNCRYPIGHPTIIRKNFEDLSNYFGLIKCRVLAPAGLYHSVLPMKVNGKLMFPLCKQCAITASAECHHS